LQISDRHYTNFGQASLCAQNVSFAFEFSQNEVLSP